MTKRNRNDPTSSNKQLSTRELTAVTGGTLASIATAAAGGALSGAYDYGSTDWISDRVDQYGFGN